MHLHHWSSSVHRIVPGCEGHSLFLDADAVGSRPGLWGGRVIQHFPPPKLNRALCSCCRKILRDAYCTQIVLEEFRGQTQQQHCLFSGGEINYSHQGQSLPKNLNDSRSCIQTSEERRSTDTAAVMPASDTQPWCFQLTCSQLPPGYCRELHCIIYPFSTDAVLVSDLELVPI